MEISGIKNIHPSSKKGWKLTDSLRERITALAKEDAAQNVYTGNQFLALRKSEVAKVAPDRAANNFIEGRCWSWVLLTKELRQCVFANILLGLISREQGRL